MGELAEEFSKTVGHSIKPDNGDGIVGECVDVIVCILDIFQLQYPEKSSLDVQDILDDLLEAKINKWKAKVY